MIKDQLQEVIDILKESLADSDKFDRGNASAGVRTRKTAMEAVKCLKDLRENVLAVKNARKTIKRK